jgi:hypothetical protein
MFTVTWADRALDRLADIFVAVDPNTRGRIERAVSRLNTRLASDPLTEGESRSGNDRITFIDVLAVQFTVHAAQDIVRVYYVSRFGRP